MDKRILKHINKKYGLLTVKNIDHIRIRKDGTKTHYFNCECECGDIVVRNISSLKKKSISSCQKCYLKYNNIHNIGKKFNKLTIIGISDRKKTKSNYGLVYYKCKCECGNEKDIRLSDLTSGKTISCGCSKKNRGPKNNLVGMTFGKLKVIEKIQNNTIYNCVKYRTLCECGCETIVSYSNLVKKNGQKKCGNCANFRNGVLTSNIALEINNMIPNAIHNYWYKNKNIDIALINDKIAIEYDGRYWHKNKKDKDIEKSKFLIENGWKVLRIISSFSIPTKEELLYFIDLLKNNIQDFIVFNILD